MALAFEPRLLPPTHFNPYGPSKGAGAGGSEDGGIATMASSPGVSPMTYHWRRAGAALVVLVALYMAWLIVGVMGSWLVTTAEASDSLAPAPAMEYVVQPGDTLWTVASSLDTNRDIRSVVGDLVDANGGVAIQPGQTIDLAVAYG